MGSLGLARISRAGRAMLIFGTKFRESAGTQSRQISRCTNCGFEGQFIERSGRNYFTLYFVIPVFPVGSASRFAECPQCKTRYPMP